MSTRSIATPSAWATWHNKLQDPLALLRARIGVPAKTAFEVAETLELPQRELEALYELSYRTLRTHSQEDRLLSTTNSEKTLKMMALHELGSDVFGQSEAFLRWLNKPAHGLDQETPLTLLETVGGIDLVAEELRRIAYGDLS